MFTAHIFGRDVCSAERSRSHRRRSRSIFFIDRSQTARLMRSDSSKRNVGSLRFLKFLDDDLQVLRRSVRFLDRACRSWRVTLAVRQIRPMSCGISKERISFFSLSRAALIFDFSRDAAMRMCSAIGPVPAGDRDVGGEARAFGADGFFDDLDQYGLIGFEHLAIPGLFFFGALRGRLPNRYQNPYQTSLGIFSCFPGMSEYG